MKKFLTALCLIVMALPLFANAPLSYITSGSWGYYTDNRTSTEVYRGFLIINDNESNTSTVYLKVVTNPKKPKTDVQYAVDIIYNEENTVDIGNIYSIQNFTKDSLNDSTIIQSALDILNFDIMYSSNIIGYDTTLEDPWSENLTLLYHFNKALPLFRFDYINEKGYDGDYIKMNRYGLARTEKDIENFLATTKQDLKIKEDTRDFSYDSAKSKKQKISGITYTLDENWTYQPADNTQLESAILSKYSDRDASVIVEDLSGQISLKTEVEMIFFAQMMILTQENLIPDSIKASYEGKMLTISFTTVDKNNENLKTTQFFKITNKGKIIEMFAFEKCYQDNKEYFDKILQTAK